MIKIFMSILLVALAACSGHAEAQTQAPPAADVPHAGYDAALATKLGGNDMGMRSYVLVILHTGPKAAPKGDARDTMFQGHFANMKRLDVALDLPFHYLLDDTQDVARAYDAVCTPDFYGFDADLRLQYRGRLDASRKEAAPEDAPRELFDAMRLIAQYGYGPAEQHPSMGCSIKWREDAPQHQASR